MQFYHGSIYESRTRAKEQTPPETWRGLSIAGEQCETALATGRWSLPCYSTSGSNDTDAFALQDSVKRYQWLTILGSCARFFSRSLISRTQMLRKLTGLP